MPGNIIQINRAKELEWYVGDSKMENLIKYLDEVGFKTTDNIFDPKNYEKVEGEEMKLPLDSRINYKFSIR